MLAFLFAPPPPARVALTPLYVAFFFASITIASLLFFCVLARYLVRRKNALDLFRRFGMDDGVAPPSVDLGRLSITCSRLHDIAIGKASFSSAPRGWQGEGGL